MKNSKKTNVFRTTVALTIALFLAMCGLLTSCQQITYEGFLLAGMQSSSYTVTYNANGATSGTVPDAQTKTKGATLTLATNSGNLAKTGYIFAGWNTAADESGTDYAEGANYSAGENITLYAKWNVAIDAYLTFSSSEIFTLSSYNSNKTWNGTLQFSTDKTSWAEWDATTIASSSATDAEGKYNLYLRGINNTVIIGNNYSAKWELASTGTSTIACSGNVESLLDFTAVAAGNHPSMGDYCFYRLFYGCTALSSAPTLPATTLSASCYSYMFASCTALTTIPALPATTLTANCYNYMFYGCTSIKMSETKTGDYGNVYRVPTSGIGTTANYALGSMFSSTGGTFKSDAEINGIYYTSNTIVGGEEPNFVGTWNLTKIYDGTDYNDPGTTGIVMVINEDGTCTMTFSNGGTPLNSSGTWTGSNGTYTTNTTDGAVLSFVISGDTATMKTSDTYILIRN